MNNARYALSIDAVIQPAEHLMTLGSTAAVTGPAPEFDLAFSVNGVDVVSLRARDLVLQYPGPLALDDMLRKANTYDIVQSDIERQLARLVLLLQRIRAGWLPHRVGPSDSGTWWWGRPRSADGFTLWSEGKTPAMSIVEQMSADEVDAWVGSLHPYAPELDND